jgi:hypothetical protein
MLVGVLLLFPSPRFSHLLIVWLTSNEGIPCTSQVNAEEVSLRMKERHSQGKQRGRLRENTIEKSEPSKKSISPPVESDPIMSLRLSAPTVQICCVCKDTIERRVSNGSHVELYGRNSY